MRRLIPVAVGDEAAFRRQQRAGMVVPFADGRRIGQAGNHLAAFVAHAAQRVAQHLEGDGVELHGPTRSYRSG